MIKDVGDSWQSGKAKSITFIVTKDCQLACKYCYLVGKNDKERMSWDIAKAAVDYILDHEEDFREESVIWDFIGGEPFLEIDLIDRVCDYIKKELYRRNHHWFNSYRFSFSTNGINYDSDKVQNFIKKNQSHISIGITIDGTKAKHDLNRIWKGNGSERGSYEDVVRNIPLWLKQFPYGGTKVTISSADMDNQNWCGAGRMLSIDAAGNFYPCTRFAQYSLRNKKAWIIGNIHDGIDKNKLRPFLALDRCTQSTQECIDCEVASGCAWCQGENYDAADTPTIYQRSTAICKMHKARVRANNYYWNKLFRKLELEGKRDDFENKKHSISIENC